MLIRAIIILGGEAVTYSELKRLLKKAGCRKVSEGTNHEFWYSPITQKSFPVGRHNTQEVATGTFKSIMADAGIK